MEEGHLLSGHVHMLVSIRPGYAVAQVVGYLKGKSTVHIARSHDLWLTDTSVILYSDASPTGRRRDLNPEPGDEWTLQGLGTSGSLGRTAAGGFQGGCAATRRRGRLQARRPGRAPASFCITVTANPPDSNTTGHDRPHRPCLRRNPSQPTALPQLACGRVPVRGRSHQLL